MKTGIIILAAGSARRYGKDKRLADLNGKPMLMHSIEAFAELGSPLLIVSNHSLPQTIRDQIVALADLKQIAAEMESSPDFGMGDSLALGIQFAQQQGWDAALIALGDMPFVKTKTVAEIQDQLRRYNSVVPVYGKQWGHPVGFRKVYFSELAKLSGDKGARAILTKSTPYELPVEDPGVVTDVDYPEQLQQAIEYIAH